MLKLFSNPRDNDAAVDVVASSIREFGFRVPLVVDAEGVIVCGHTRYNAALKLGLEAGAPANADGTVNLVHYAAWLVKELARGN